MIEYVNLYRFEQAFREHGRQDSFSYDGLKALFEYLEQWEDDTCEQIELDVVAICGDFTEYKDIEDYNDQNGTDYEDREEVDNYIPVGNYGLIVHE
jgi:hypothetical protein